MFLNKKRDNKAKVYCKNCKRFNIFSDSFLNLCKIPDCGLPFYNRYEYTDLDSNFNFDKAKGIFSTYNCTIDKKGQKFIKKHLSKIETNSIEDGTIVGHPSELNYNNNCYFYKRK